MTEQPQALLDEIREVLGDSFSRWLFGIDDDVSLEGVKLSPVQLEAMNRVHLLAGQLRAAGESQLSWHLAQSLLSSQGKNISPGEEIRAFSLGEHVEIQPASSLSEYVKKVSLQMYPALLMERDGIKPMIPLVPRPSLSLKDDIGHQLLLADKDLGRLFGEDPMQSTETMFFSTGNGNGVQGAMVPSLVWAAASARTRARRIDRETLEAAVDEVLDEMRRMARGETVEVPAVCLIRGLRLPGGREVNLPWGTVRNMGATEAVNFGSTMGFEVEQDDAVFETTFPLSMVEKDVESIGQSEFEAWQKDYEKFDGKLRLARLALLLSSDAHPLNACRVGSIAFLAPWQHAPNVRSFGGDSWSSIVEIREPKLTTSVAESLNAHDLTHLNITIRRMLLAYERPNETDSFIDTIIAWEGMFGARAEQRLRISASIARLLETDPDARQGLFKRAQKLYDERSGLVHGASMTVKEITEKRAEALSIAKRSLVTLLTEFPELVQEPSGNRSKYLILIDRHK